MQALKFLTPDLVRQIAAAYGTPVYVYSEAVLRKSAQTALAFPNAYGLTVRYAIKANSTGAILSLFNSMGIHFDASSSYEVHRLLLNGVHPSRIQLTAQELAPDLKELVERGILFNACSLHQLETYGKCRPGRDVSIRINPGIGSGHSNRTNVGGPSSSFGIWIDHLKDVTALADTYRLRITKLHSHIGSGSDPRVWKKVVGMNLDAVRALPDVTVLNMGGGFKIGRMPEEHTTDLRVIGDSVKPLFEQFFAETGRKIALEIEPGTWLAAAGGALITAIDDKVDTGKEGYIFLKTDTGMSEILRPTLYGARHMIRHVPRTGEPSADRESVVIVGHACESGDILTPVPGDSEGVDTLTLPKAAIGDYLVIEDAGAYCASMCAVNYNSFPQAAEVMLRENGETTLIRKRQTLEQMLQNEL
ncbi:MAG: diaminopimelate decarboxylase [Candidatus Neomarinimicrobiota bacterium]